MKEAGVDIKYQVHKYCYVLTRDGVIFVLFTYNSFPGIILCTGCAFYLMLWWRKVQCSAVSARAFYPRCALRKIVTADNNIATFSASKPYLFLTWKALRRVHKYLKKKTNILWHFFGEGKWIILRTACICQMSDIS